MTVEEYLNECNVDPNERISTSEDSWWVLKALIESYIEEEGLVKNNVDLANVVLRSEQLVCELGATEHNKAIYHAGQCHRCYLTKTIE